MVRTFTYHSLDYWQINIVGLKPIYTLLPLPLAPPNFHHYLLYFKYSLRVMPVVMHLEAHIPVAISVKLEVKCIIRLVRQNSKLCLCDVLVD